MDMVKSNLFFILTLLFLTILLAACSAQEPEDTPQPAPATSAAGDEVATEDVEEVPTPGEPASEKTGEPDPTMAPDDEGVEPEAPGEDEGVEMPTPQGSGLAAEIVSGEFAGAGKPFTFDATQSEAGESPIEAYEWDMGDGTFLFGLAVQHVYDEPGDYTVTLTIVDEDGQRNATTRIVEVIPLEDLLTPTAVSQDPTVALIGTFWLMNNPMRGTIITLNFDEDDLSGSSGCNSYSAGYTITAADGPATSISVGSISGTSQTCTREIMAQEQGYLDVLASASSYRFDGDTLILETGSGALTFSPAVQ
jgi:heat shock protein HslJ/chitodextrinase